MSATDTARVAAMPNATEVEDIAARLGLTTRFSFFTGKGGVGKTTTAAAVAIALARRGAPTLLVSTDPASNLGDLLGIEHARVPTAIHGLPTLSVLDIDPVAAADAYRERVVGPVRGLLPDAAIRQMEEQLSGACTVEIAAFDEFTALLTDEVLAERFAHIVFDTAPTGHTLRLLALPTAWTGFLDSAQHGASCLGPMAGLEKQRARYAEAVDALADAARTTVVLVTRAETSPLTEAARASQELAALGMRAQRLVINALLDDDHGDAVAQDWIARQQAALAAMPDALRGLPTLALPVRAGSLTGLAPLTDLARSPTQPPSFVDAYEPAPDAAPSSTTLPPIEALADELAAVGHGAVLTMGKGGVGKTRVATTLAVALAERGVRVHLSTTDPAGRAFDLPLASLPTLRVSRIDPVAETARYADDVLAAAGALSPEERALIAEDLRSPCTEEIAVFKAFARVLAEATHDVVVLDTAPTGHTILLLDAAQAYHREVLRGSGTMPAEVTALLPRLRDPGFTRVLVVALAEATPVAEAERLEQDLSRAGIQPFGWVLNGLLSRTDTRHPALRARAAGEALHVARACANGRRIWAMPWSATS